MTQGQHDEKTIFIIEDDAEIGAMLLQVIRFETFYQVVLATDSLQALEVVKNIQPILFIFNYWLPHMNGIELYDKLHAIPALARVPALMMSAYLPNEELEKRGIVGIAKPFDLDDLLATIVRLID